VVAEDRSFQNGSECDYRYQAVGVLVECNPVTNRNAMANTEALNLYRDIPELQ
jgi:hypothetical protein